MNRLLHEKLVRDRVPDIVREDGDTPIFRTTQFPEKGRALLRKLVEEAIEVEEAQSRKQLFEELADLKEVFDAICTEYMFTAQDIAWKQGHKRRRRGGFERGIILEDIIPYGTKGGL